MDKERIEQELQEYFKAEAHKVEPSKEWWNNALSRVDQQKQTSQAEKPAFWKLRPSLITVPLSIVLLVILVGGLVASMGGMSPPPQPAPSVVSDDAGGTFLVWLDHPYFQYEATIRAQHVDAQGNRLWGEIGKQIAGGDASFNGAVGDGMGGMIVTWRKGYGSSLERLDQAGNTVWILENLWVSENTSWSVMEMTEDGSGGAIILLYDRIDHIYAQRVSGNGIPVWGDKGVLIDTTGNDYVNASIVGDGLGGAVIVWQKKNGVNVVIRAQRFSPEGKATWVEGGVALASIENGQGNSQQVTSDGAGNFFVAWDTASFGPNSDVYIQKLDESGNTLWGDQGIPVSHGEPSETNPMANMRSSPQLVADGTGGVVVTWNDRRRILNREIFVQRFNAAGEALWTENGVWVWDIPSDYPQTAGILGSTLVPDGDGGATVVWTGYNAPMRSSVIYAQKLSPDGKRLWPNEEVYNNTSFQSQGYSSIAGDGKGGIIIGSRVGEASGISRTDSIYAQRIDAAGNKIWGKAGLEIERIHSALTVQFIAVGSILAAILVLTGVFRRNRIAKVFTAVLPIFLGIAGLFSVLLVIGPFGYTYGWAYVPDTPANKVAAFIVPLASLAICAVGIGKKTVTRWVMIPVMIFCILIAAIAGLVFIF
jgi:hypothetical protein